jgi:hypothetical protein
MRYKHRFTQDGTNESTNEDKVTVPRLVNFFRPLQKWEKNGILRENFSVILSAQPENLAQVGENRTWRLALPNLEQSRFLQKGAKKWGS